MPAARLRSVPPRARAGLKKLLDLDPAARERLLAGLREERPALHSTALTSALRGKAGSLTDAELDEIVEALVSLSYGRMRFDMKLPEFVSELVQLDELAIGDDRRADAQRFFEALMSSQAIAGTAKVNDVVTEHERLFLGARIVTDVRPIFGESPSETLGAAVVHMLKISYHSALEDLDFYVALDEEDLGELREVIARADAKAQNLRELLQTAGVRDFRDGKKA